MGNIKPARQKQAIRIDLRGMARRLFRFSLRSLLLMTLLIGSAGTLWLHWPAWILEHTFSPHSLTIGEIAISPDQRTIATSTDDRDIRIWNLGSNESLVIAAAHKDRIWGLNFSPDGKKIVSASLDHTARIWNVKTGKELCVLEGHSGEVRDASFSPDGTRVVTAGGASGSRPDKTVRIWNAENGNLIHILKGHEDNVNSVVFSRDGKYLLSASKDYTVRIWNISEQREISKQKLDEIVLNAEFSPDGKLIAAGVNGGARLWNSEHPPRKSPESSYRSNIKWLSGGERICTIDGDGKLRIWNISLNEQFVIADDLQQYFDLAYAGERIAYQGPDNTCKVLRNVHSEQWWGVLTLPEFWLTLTLALVFFASLYQDHRPTGKS